MPVVRAKELDAHTGHHGLALSACDHCQVFSEVADGIEGVVRDLNPCGGGADFVGDRVQELFLGERAVVGDVEGLADRVLLPQREQQPLDDICDVDKGKHVVARPDDDAFPGAQPVRNPAEMQVVPRPEERAGADDDGVQAVLRNHPLHGYVAGGLRDRIGLIERPQQEVFTNWLAQSHPVDHP